MKSIDEFYTTWTLRHGSWIRNTKSPRIVLRYVELRGDQKASSRIYWDDRWPAQRQAVLKVESRKVIASDVQTLVCWSATCRRLTFNSPLQIPQTWKAHFIEQCRGQLLAVDWNVNLVLSGVIFFYDVVDRNRQSNESEGQRTVKGISVKGAGDYHYCDCDH